jgi:expansin
MINARRSALAVIALVFGCSSQDAQNRNCGTNNGACVSESSAGNSSGGARTGGGGSFNAAGMSAVGGSVSGGGAGFVNGGASGLPSGGASYSGGASGSVGGGSGMTNAGGTTNTGGSTSAGGKGGTGAGGTTSAGGKGGASSVSGAGGSTSAGGAAGNGNIVGQCTAPIPGLPSYNGNGSVTSYTFAMGSNCPTNTPPTNKCVNCGYPVTSVSPDTVSHAYTNNGQYFAAMNTEDFNGAAACGACVQVTRDGSRSVVATVVDQCPLASNPKCKKGHIDLSQAAFLQLGTEAEGYLGTGNGGMVGSISWKYVACPVPATQDVTMRLKEPDNEYYTAVIIQDDLFPIKSVKINGAAATLDPASNFWLVGSGNQAPGPWDVRAVDVNGWGFEATLAQGQSGDVSTGHRATCN